MYYNSYSLSDMENQANTENLVFNMAIYNTQ